MIATGKARNLAPFLACLCAVGCAGIPARNPIPEERYLTAQIPGIPRARMWGDEPPPWWREWIAMSPEVARARYPALYGREHTYLAISGGGDNGAFGAGLLCGWSAAGTRPTFTLVTGISTGALIAPFAFLGSAYDEQLEEIYTRYSTEDLVEERSLLSALFSDAFATTEPLRALIARYIDRELMEAIAAESRKGRALLIGTTNLDAGRPVIWNIGAIATSGAPGALKLIRKVLLASASIPVAFPPVLIEVEAGGESYDELHVDGGATSQVFLYPLGVDWQRVLEKLEVPGRPQVYVIRNAQLASKWESVEPGLASIAMRTISSLIRTQGIGDMYRIYLGAQRDGLDFHVSYIPDDFTEEPQEMFDPKYMRQLFDLGGRMAREGHPWREVPPGLHVGQQETSPPLPRHRAGPLSARSAR